MGLPRSSSPRLQPPTENSSKALTHQSPSTSPHTPVPQHFSSHTSPPALLVSAPRHGRGEDRRREARGEERGERRRERREEHTARRGVLSPFLRSPRPALLSDSSS
eukprot:768741-Hanusia_phi.AAC.12